MLMPVPFSAAAASQEVLHQTPQGHGATVCAPSSSSQGVTVTEAASTHRHSSLGRSKLTVAEKRLMRAGSRSCRRLVAPITTAVRDRGERGWGGQFLANRPNKVGYH